MREPIKAIEDYLDQYTVKPNLVGDVIHGAHFKGDVGAEIRQSDLRNILELINQLTSDNKRYKKALESIASYEEGKDVTSGFDEPHSAKIAREALEAN